MSDNILIVNKTQFGYHTDYFKYCEYLKGQFNITFLCFDSNLKKNSLSGVEVKYISCSGSRILRGIRYVMMVIKYISCFKGLIFVNYFEHCEILKKIFHKKKMILDIRTLSISPDKTIRNKYDKRLKNACSYFDYITVISVGIQKKLHLNEYNSSILPLGADVISGTKKDFSQLKLLYVGTLSGRNIAETIKGFSLFRSRHSEIEDITYDIVGDGYESELNDLRQLVRQLQLCDKITLHGRIPYNELQPFFDKSNIGISYVPITEYYEYQPVTKTYEYILSGMVCVATETYENKLIINSLNGILCNDNVRSFANALESLFNNLLTYNSETIRSTLLNFTWNSIVSEKLIPILQSYL